MEVYFPKEDLYRTLGSISPVVHALATQQFDDYVKRVRVFVHPRLADEMRALPSAHALVEAALAKMA